LHQQLHPERGGEKKEAEREEAEAEEGGERERGSLRKKNPDVTHF
jgi:hypothetical protein